MVMDHSLVAIKGHVLDEAYVYILVSRQLQEGCQLLLILASHHHTVDLLQHKGCQANIVNKHTFPTHL